MKYFVCSDIHGFYNEMIESLKRSGYDKTNPDHFLVVCGDLLDRGKQPYECLKFVNSIPYTNKALIKGNHESLLQDCFIKREFKYYDFVNGTFDTVVSIFSKIRNEENNINGLVESHYGTSYIDSEMIKIVRENEEVIKYFSSLKDYHETKNCIFVHGWIPSEDYKNAGSSEWEQARWVNGFDEGFANRNYTGKDIIFGHWHCSYGWHKEFPDKYKEFSSDKSKENFDPYYGHNFIGIDACTAYSKKVNVEVFIDEPLN